MHEPFSSNKHARDMWPLITFHQVNSIGCIWLTTIPSQQSAILNEPTSISIGGTTSMPYTNENGVAPVDVWNDVWYAHHAKGRFFDQFRGVLTIFRRIILILLFVASTTSLVYGLCTYEWWCWVPYSSTSVSTSLLKCTPLSEINSWGILYR